MRQNTPKRAKNGAVFALYTKDSSKQITDAEYDALSARRISDQEKSVDAVVSNRYNKKQGEEEYVFLYQRHSGRDL